MATILKEFMAAQSSKRFIENSITIEELGLKLMRYKRGNYYRNYTNPSLHFLTKDCCYNNASIKILNSGVIYTC